MDAHLYIFTEKRSLRELFLCNVAVTLLSLFLEISDKLTARTWRNFALHILKALTCYCFDVIMVATVVNNQTSFACKLI
ncbi:unnamed protein product [Prunus brigantina]